MLFLAFVPLVQAEIVPFKDTFNRTDGSTSYDSLGATEVAGGFVYLDYREMDASGGRPTITDISHLENGALIIHGTPGTTNPAFAELDNAGTDFDYEVTAEFLSNVSNADNVVALQEIRARAAVERREKVSREHRLVDGDLAPLVDLRLAPQGKVVLEMMHAAVLGHLFLASRAQV